MIRPVLWGCGWLAAAGVGLSQSDPGALTKQPWFESRTLHFHTYSYGPTQAVAKLAARLEQFQEAYSLLAGSQAVASPPIIVIAFPDHEALMPYLPLYQGRPANLAAFFVRGSDENLITLSLDAGGLESVFHEYTHLLFRHNARFWPVWLNEGIAEIYSTFEVTGPHTVLIGRPITHHLRLLSGKQWMPLKTLFGVTHGSPEYNEREHQGVFYAESWLLTHYLMSGAPPAIKGRFGQFTALLRQGQLPEPAFVSALQTSLPAVETQLRKYLEAGKFEPIQLSVPADLSAPRSMATRGLTPVEILFRLGDELFRLGRLDAAESLFVQARKLAPASPLPYEGLGLLAVHRGEAESGLALLQQALDLRSANYLAHYAFAAQKFQLTARSDERYSRVHEPLAGQIRSELEKALTLMPEFGPAHHLLGFFELVQRGDLADAQRHLERAIQLEPENQGYLLSLAEVELARKDSDAARRTLEALRMPYVEPKLRTDAEELLQEMTRQTGKAR